MGLFPYNDRIQIETFTVSGVDSLNKAVKVPTVLFDQVPCLIQVYAEQGGHGSTLEKTGEVDTTKLTIFVDIKPFPGITNKMNVIVQAAADPSLVGKKGLIAIARPYRLLNPHWELFVHLGRGHG